MFRKIFVASRPDAAAGRVCLRFCARGRTSSGRKFAGVEQRRECVRRVPDFGAGKFLSRIIRARRSAATRLFGCCGSTAGGRSAERETQGESCGYVPVVLPGRRGLLRGAAADGNQRADVGGLGGRDPGACGSGGDAGGSVSSGAVFSGDGGEGFVMGGVGCRVGTEFCLWATSCLD